MTAWVWAIALTLLVAASFLLARRQRVRRFSVRNRSPEHEAKVTALTEWFSTPKIRSVLRDYEGVSPHALDGLRDIIGRMDEESVDNVLREKVLGVRQVRQVIAHHVAKKHGVSQFEAMKALLEWAGKVEEVA